MKITACVMGAVALAFLTTGCSKAADLDRATAVRVLGSLGVNNASFGPELKVADCLIGTGMMQPFFFGGAFAVSPKGLSDFQRIQIATLNGGVVNIAFARPQVVGVDRVTGISTVPGDPDMRRVDFMMRLGSWNLSPVNARCMARAQPLQPAYAIVRRFDDGWRMAEWSFDTLH